MKPRTDGQCKASHQHLIQYISTICPIKRSVPLFVLLLLCLSTVSKKYGFIKIMKIKSVLFFVSSKFHIKTLFIYHHVISLKHLQNVNLSNKFVPFQFVQTAFISLLIICLRVADRFVKLFAFVFYCSN